MDKNILIVYFLFICTVNCSIYHEDEKFHSDRSRMKRSDQGNLDMADNNVDTVCHKQVEKLTSTPEDGNCAKFNDQHCFCLLSDNCEFDVVSKTCMDRTGCSKFNGHAIACRRSHCFYDCTTKLCSNGDDCVNGCDMTVGTCNQHCDDVCSCNAMNCQFAQDGSCKENRNIDCTDQMFDKQQCGRKNSFYLNNGIFCKNSKQRGNCTLSKTILGVNLGGDIPVTDFRGITFDTDDNVTYQDVEGIRLEHHLGINDSFSQDNRNLYETIVINRPPKKEDGGCIKYEIPLCKNGHYELIINSIEVFDVLPGEKHFNVKFAGHYVFTEVDIARLAGSRFKPIELIMNFQIRENLLILNNNGKRTFPIVRGMVPLEFCASECFFGEGYFEIAAFAVNKFVDWDNKRNTDSQYCNSLNGLSWECRNALCSYDISSGECTAAVVAAEDDTNECKGQGEKPVVEKPGNCTNTGTGGGGTGTEGGGNGTDGGGPETDLGVDTEHPLDVLFLLDSSGSYSKTRNSSSESLVFKEFKRIINVMDVLKTTFPKLPRFAISLFSDYTCYAYPDMDCNEPLDDTGKLHHTDEYGCYRVHYGLTTDMRALKSRVDLMTLRPSSDKEPGLFGAYMSAIVDGYIYWTAPKRGAKKLIVLITDDGLQMTKLPNKYPATGSASVDTCYGTTHPDADFINKILLDKEFGIMFLVEKKSDKDSYEEVVKKMTFPHEFQFIAEDTAVLASKMIKFIKKMYK